MPRQRMPAQRPPSAWLLSRLALAGACPVKAAADDGGARTAGRRVDRRDGRRRARSPGAPCGPAPELRKHGLARDVREFRVRAEGDGRGLGNLLRGGARGGENEGHAGERGTAGHEADRDWAYNSLTRT